MTTLPVGLSFVHHDGRRYLATELLMHVPASYLRELHTASLATDQDIWSEVARRWPKLAATIIAEVACI